MGSVATPSNSAVNYFPVMAGSTTYNATESNVLMIMPTAGTISGLKVLLDGAPGAGKSYTFVLMVDSVASALSVAISGTNVRGTSPASVAVTAGQTLSIRCTPAGTPDSVKAAQTMVFTGTTANESVLMGSAAALHVTNTEYAGVMVGSLSPSTIETGRQGVCAGAGTLSDFYVSLSADPGNSPEAYRLTLRLNGASQTLTVTITADSTTGNDTANSVAVVAGDLINILIEPLNSPTVAPVPAWGMVFTATTDGQSLHPCAAGNDIHDTDDRIADVVGGTVWLNVAAGTLEALAQNCKFTALYIDLETAPGLAASGDSHAFTIQNNGATGNLTVTILETATTGNDTANEDILGDFSLPRIHVSPTSLPTRGLARWGFLQEEFVPPVIAGNLLSKMVAAGFI